MNLKAFWNKLFKKESIYTYGCCERQKDDFDSYHFMKLARLNKKTNRVESCSYSKDNTWYQCGYGWELHFRPYPEQSQELYRRQYDEIKISY